MARPDVTIPLVVERATLVQLTPEAVFAWHLRLGAFERLTPPWERVRVEKPGGPIANGSEVTLSIRKGPLALHWVARHTNVVPPDTFTDEQVKGPFHQWTHQHRFDRADGQRCRLTDRISCVPPLGSVGSMLGTPFLRRQLERLLEYRHAVTLADFRDLAQFQDQPRLTIAITGASGLVGSALVPYLRTQGHRVRPLVRGKAEGDEISWNPAAGTLDPDDLEGTDVVVHLAGENLAAGAWTASRKAELRASRVRGATVLATAIRQLSRPSRLFLSASAIGYYGDRGNEILTEASGIGVGFLPELCHEWEQACLAIQDQVRVVCYRFGLVLTPAGGALGKLLPVFRAGLGGPAGGGKQWMSWVSIEDVVAAIQYACYTEELHGAVNLVAPDAVTNATFGQTIGRVLHRPAMVPVPAFALRLGFGEMADATLLASTRVVPERLAASGYGFRHRSLEAALRHLLGVRPLSSQPS